MATPISLARGVLTPRRRASCSQGSEGGVLAPRAARGARSPTPRSPEELKSASSRTLSPEEDVPVTSTESPAEILSKFRLYDLGSQELVDLRLQDLEHRVQALERAYEVSKESNGAKLQEPFQRKGLHSEEKLWDELTAKLHAEASRQASVLACKTEQQLAMVDRQLAELLGKAQALIQQSAAQEEERLSVQSGHMLQEIRAQLGWVEPSEVHAPQDWADGGARDRPGRGRQHSARYVAAHEVAPAESIVRLPVEPVARGVTGDTSPMATSTSVAELLAKLQQSAAQS
ncbi:unnamed protein product [Effrenium voratum]|nr:unnamed protein product [Effrenium voratum]